MPSGSSAEGMETLALETAEATAEWLHRRLRELWGFPDPVVRAIAGQPVRPDAPGASLAEHLLAAAHHRAVQPDAPLPWVEGAFVDAERAARWETA